MAVDGNIRISGSDRQQNPLVKKLIYKSASPYPDVGESIMSNCRRRYALLRRLRGCLLAALAAVFFGVVEAGSAPIGPADVAEPEVDSTYTTLILEHTTGECFISPLVDHLPQDPDVPSPLEFLGYAVGTPKTLTYYADIKAYMEVLAASSPNVRLHSMGQSNEGKEMIVVLIADENTLDDIDRYKTYTQRLADSRTTNESEAEAIIRQAKPFYYVAGGLHSTETGPPEMLMELAYRLAVLGEIHLPRQQPRRHTDEPTAHPQCRPNVSRIPSAVDARPPRIGAASLCLVGDRTVWSQL
jgi:hypothetical protein